MTCTSSEVLRDECTGGATRVYTWKCDGLILLRVRRPRPRSQRRSLPIAVPRRAAAVSRRQRRPRGVRQRHLKQLCRPPPPRKPHVHLNLHLRRSQPRRQRGSDEPSTAQCHDLKSCEVLVGGLPYVRSGVTERSASPHTKHDYIWAFAMSFGVAVTVAVAMVGARGWSFFIMHHHPRPRLPTRRAIAAAGAAREGACR